MCPKNTHAHIRTLCASRLGSALLVPALLEALHDAVESCWNSSEWIDALDAQTHWYSERGAVPALEVSGSVERVGGGHLNSAVPCSHEPMPRGERRVPADAVRRLQGSLRSRNGKLLGSIELCRLPHRPAFTAADVLAFDSLIPPIAAALEVTPCEYEPRFVPKPHPQEFVLLTLDAHVRCRSPGAQRLLALANGGLTASGFGADVEELARRHVKGLLQELRSFSDSIDVNRPPSASLSILSSYGRFDVHGALLIGAKGDGQGERLALLMIRWMEPHCLALLRAMRGMRLSGSQAQVCEALYQGTPRSMIARRLGVAKSTVVDHVRKLYCALDVSSVGQLKDVLDRKIGST